MVNLQNIKRNKLGNGLSGRDRKDIIFILLVTLLPMLQFFVFYLVVNINSVIMAFQTYEVNPATNLGSYVPYGLENFKRAWLELTTDSTMLTSLTNSLTYFVVYIFVGITLALLFSYYIFKKAPLHSAFKVVLFLPTIMTSVVLILMYKYFADYAVSKMLSTILKVEFEGLISSSKTAFGAVVFYAIWFGFGSNVLMYSSAMSGISDSMIEAAQLDGVNALQEFWYVIVPSIYPTLSTFLVTATAAFFTADVGLFSFFGPRAETYTWTVGYYLLRQTKVASVAEYPYLACLGFIFTVVSLPLTFVVRRLLNKFGPSEV